MIDHVSKRQQRLAILLRAISGPIWVEDAAQVLALDRAHTAKLLAGWHKQGVIRRVARGLYVPVQPTALGRKQVLEDPWILIPELYEPGYVGGWSALEYWELTEQLFRSVCVLTSKRTTYGETQHQGVQFFIKHLPAQRLFGTKTLWRDNVRIQISDLHKTILDVIDDPYLGAGLQHTIDCLREYKKITQRQDGADQLIQYALKINAGALFKKLGFLAEKLDFDNGLINECADHLTTGYAYLDKGASDQKLVTKWRLWVPRGYDL